MPSSPAVTSAAGAKAGGKVKTKGAVCTDKKEKKVRSATASTASPAPAATLRGASSTKSGDLSSPIGLGKPTARPARMTLERNPSMFGELLPHLHIPSSNSNYSSALGSQPQQKQSQKRGQAALQTPIGSPIGSPRERALPALPTVPTVVATPRQVKTLRRVRRLAPSRRISFGSLVAPGDGDDADVEGEDGEERELGSAFQLQ